MGLFARRSAAGGGQSRASAFCRKMRLLEVGEDAFQLVQIRVTDAELAATAAALEDGYRRADPVGQLAEHLQRTLDVPRPDLQTDSPADLVKFVTTWATNNPKKRLLPSLIHWGSIQCRPQTAS